MSVIRVTKSDVESFTLVTTPSRNYSSSSLGVTGSVKVFPRLSGAEKDKEELNPFSDSSVSSVVDGAFDTSYVRINNSSRSKRKIGESISQEVENYLDLVNVTPSKKIDTLEIERIVPTAKFTKYNLIKTNIKEALMKNYRSEYLSSDWSYTNYNSLNFFTDYLGSSPVFPTGSVLIYPNVVDDRLPLHDGYVSGSYCLSGAFSFEFYINPRYRDDGRDNVFRAGTLLHLSSSYAVSLTTGSLRNHNGDQEGFRLQLQFSHSADYSPSSVSPGSFPFDLVFQSDDNCLRHNNWHHVVIRWGTNLLNNGTGSFIVDGVNRGNFVIPSGTIMPKAFVDSSNPDALFVGNFYEGTNSGNNSQSLFFSDRPSKRDGVYRMSLVDDKDDPVDYKFEHPLNAEIHDLAIRRYYYSDAEMEYTGSRGIGSDAKTEGIAFYLPPFFTEETPIRRVVNDRGGIMQTPFFAIDGSTDDPFNIAMSFGVNGHYINLENFTKDFSTGRFPRLLDLSGSTIDHTTTAQEANQFLYADSKIAKRNLTILPCDDGDFDPNYELMSLERYRGKYTNSLSFTDYSLVNLDNLVSTSSVLYNGLNSDLPDEFVEETYGASPESPGLRPGPAYSRYISQLSSDISTLTQDSEFNRGAQLGAPLTIYQRTLDPSSNQVTIFNISNLYYGKRILPGSFLISDAGISGSNGRVSISLRDDSLGNLYRSDSDTSHYTQGSVGNIFYDEGIVVIKSPHLYFFGKNQYEISFRGVQNIFTQKYEIIAPQGLLNSSSNPSYAENYEDISPSGDPKDDEDFVYISGLNFHDENMNVVAKARLAQPIIKREGDKILFKVTFDY